MPKGERAEEAARKSWRETFDLASARAVAALPMLAEYCLPLVRVGGTFGHEGASGAEELAAAQGAIKSWAAPGGTRSVQLPGGDERTLIFVRKDIANPDSLPRNGGKIAKSPLK